MSTYIPSNDWRNIAIALKTPPDGAGQTAQTCAKTCLRQLSPTEPFTIEARAAKHPYMCFPIALIIASTQFTVSTTLHRACRARLFDFLLTAECIGSESPQ